MINYQLFTDRKTVEIRLEPELARLARAYRNTAEDLKLAEEKNQGILKLRLLRKLEQLTTKISGRLMKLGVPLDKTFEWVNDLENKIFTEEEAK